MAATALVAAALEEGEEGSEDSDDENLGIFPYSGYNTKTSGSLQRTSVKERITHSPIVLIDGCGLHIDAYGPTPWPPPAFGPESLY